jgi:signal transduction histidine kinase
MDKSLFHLVKQYKSAEILIRNPIASAFVLSFVYMIVGCLWIIATDYFYFSSHVQISSDILLYKELSFVLFNGMLVLGFSLLTLIPLKNVFLNVEQQLADQDSAMKSVEREFEELTRKMSHDLRAPLRSMQGFSQAISEDYDKLLDPNAQDYLNRIRRSAERMNSLIDELVAYVKVASVSVTPEPIDVQSLITDYVLAEVNSTLPVPLLIEGSGPVPVVFADRLLLKRVLFEVLSNAGLYQRSDVAPKVVITGHQYPDRTTICLKDNGIGVDPTHHEHIFGIFTRLHGIETYPGLGIGLALARRCMLRMRGDIELKSDGNSGCEVILTFRRPKT